MAEHEPKIRHRQAVAASHQQQQTIGEKPQLQPKADKPAATGNTAKPGPVRDADVNELVTREGVQKSLDAERQNRRPVRTPAVDAAIRVVLTRPDGEGGRRPALPSELSSVEIKYLLEEVNPSLFLPQERITLLTALADDAWISPWDVPDAIPPMKVDRRIGPFGLGGFQIGPWEIKLSTKARGGPLGENEEGLINRLMSSTPKQDRVTVLEGMKDVRVEKGLVSKEQVPLLDAIRGGLGSWEAGSVWNEYLGLQDNRGDFEKAVGSAELSADRRRHARTTHADPTARASEPRRMLAQAVRDASQLVLPQYFPNGVPYSALSYRILEADPAQGLQERAQILLHQPERDPETVPLTELSLRRYNQPKDLEEAIVSAFESFHYGLSDPRLRGLGGSNRSAGLRTTPERWASLALDVLPKPEALTEQTDPANGFGLGAPALGTLAYEVKRRSTEELEKAEAKGTKARALRRRTAFQMPVASYEKLLGLQPATTELTPERIEAVKQRLHAVLDGPLKHTAKIWEATDEKAFPGSPQVLRLPNDQAKLLLEGREFTREARKLFKGDLAKLVPADWQFVRRVGTQASFVIPPEAVAAFHRVQLPATGKLDVAAYKAALEKRIEAFGKGVDVQVTEVDGKPALAVPLEHANLMLRTSLFRFHPWAKSFDVDNLYWSARLSDLVYEDFTNDQGKVDPAKLEKIKATLAPLGFTEVHGFAKDEAEVLVLSDGKQVFVLSRGTASGQDVLTDLDLFKRELTGEQLSATGTGAQKPSAELVETAFKGQTFGLHNGFGGQVLGLIHDVAAKVEELRTRDPAHPLPVWLTGHSKGGAEMSVMATGLALSGIPIQGGYGIEGARAGDGRFARLSRQLGVTEGLHQFALLLDAVPLVPPHKLGFRRIGALVIPNGPSGQPDWSIPRSEHEGAVLKSLGEPGAILHSHFTSTAIPEIERLLGGGWTPPEGVPFDEAED